MYAVRNHRTSIVWPSSADLQNGNHRPGWYTLRNSRFYAYAMIPSTIESNPLQETLVSRLRLVDLIPVSDPFLDAHCSFSPKKKKKKKKKEKN